MKYISLLVCFLTITKFTTSDAQVLDDWFDAGNGFLYHLTITKMTQNKAQLQCEAWEGRLAIEAIRDSVFFEVLNKKYKDDSFWIGLNDKYKEGKFRWDDGVPMSQTWRDGWRLGVPDDRYQKEDCVVMNSRPCDFSPTRYNDVNCNQKYLGLCEKSKGELPAYPSFDASNGYTYLLLTSQTTYEVASEKCNKIYAQLAYSPITNASLASEIATGLFLNLQPSVSKQLWVGFNDIEKEGNLVFSNKDNVTSSDVNWESGQSNNNDGRDCGIFNANSLGKVSLNNCNEIKPVLCSKVTTTCEQAIPATCLPSAGECGQDEYRELDGTCNNLLNVDRGREERGYKRMLPADFADGIGKPRGNGFLPNARSITQAVRNAEEPASSTNTNHLPGWGQFLAHDVTRFDLPGEELECPCGTTDEECINVDIPIGDPIRVDNICIPIKRGVQVKTLNCNYDMRLPQSVVTSYVDASQVYGSTDMTSMQLRDENGLLKVGNYSTSRGQGLPLLSQISSNLHSSFECEPIHRPANIPCFAGGDGRINEQPGLQANHATWIRKHNLIASELKIINPFWDGSRIFFESRKIVGAMHQVITYNEFLPALLGETIMQQFQLNLVNQGYWYGYDATYDATADLSVVTGVFRLGHSLISENLTRRHSNYTDDPDKLIQLVSQFFDSTPILEKNATGSILRGLVADHARLFDTQFTPAMIDHLFAEPGKFGFDLIAINIQRAREFGIPSYLKHRQFCGLSYEVETFDKLEDIPVSTQNQLASIYEKPEDIDLFIGGVSETALPDSTIGPLFACMMAYQFRDLKRGDSHWFENGGRFQRFNPRQIETLKEVSLAKVICEVGEGVETIQPKVMRLHTEPGNARVNCSDLPSLDLNAWKEEGGGYVSSNKINTPQDFDWTEWFPLTYFRAKKLPLKPETALLSFLRIYRPDDVCVAIMGFEKIKINGKYQFRYKCPTGSIVGTDFPPVDSLEVYWTKWSSQTTPSDPNNDDVEEVSGAETCLNPVAIQGFSVNGVPARSTGNIFEHLSPIRGLICRGSDQPSGFCEDFKVRYLCMKSST